MRGSSVLPWAPTSAACSLSTSLLHSSPPVIPPDLWLLDSLHFSQCKSSSSPLSASLSPHILCSFGRCLFVNTIFLPLPLCKHPWYTQEGAFLFPANKWSKNGAAPLISITASEMNCFPWTDPYFLLFSTCHLIKLGWINNIHEWGGVTKWRNHSGCRH